MGEKGGKKDDGQKTKKIEAPKGGGGGETKKKEGGEGVITAVLKVDMHCDGCAKKVKRSVKGFEGVESVTVDSENNKLSVVGKLDPWNLRERVEAKTHKKVVLVSPADFPKKIKETKEVEKEKKVEEKEKPKPPVVSTVVLKIRLHCEGCIQRIRRSIFKVKGVEEVTIDSGKDLVTVKGTMDVKTMVPFLTDKFKRTIEIMAPKKDDRVEEKKKDKGEKGKNKGNEKSKEDEDGGVKEASGKDGGGEKKKDGGEEKKKDGGGERKKDGGGEKKKDGGDEKKAEGEQDAAKIEVNKMDYYGGNVAPTGFMPNGYNGYNYPIEMLHAPQYFSDENPNACSVM